MAEFDISNADNANFWSEHWGKSSVKSAIEKSETGYMGGSKFLLSSIVKDDKVLEAGCGKGQIVAALEHRGIEVVGIDFSNEIIEEIKDFRPSLKVQKGDIRNLPFKDNEFSVYLSLGVIEHFSNPEDVETILNEAKRVTNRLIFLSVPYFSPVLKKNYIKLKNKENEKGEFYQYYFDKDEIENLLTKHGLKTCKVSYYATYIGLKRYHFLFKQLHKFPLFRFTFIRSKWILDKFFGKKYAHMIGLWTYKMNSNS